MPRPFCEGGCSLSGWQPAFLHGFCAHERKLGRGGALPWHWLMGKGRIWRCWGWANRVGALCNWPADWSEYEKSHLVFTVKTTGSHGLALSSHKPLGGWDSGSVCLLSPTRGYPENLRPEIWPSEYCCPVVRIPTLPRLQAPRANPLTSRALIPQRGGNLKAYLVGLLLFSRSVVSNSLRPHGLQYARLPWPSPSPGACPDACPLSRWCYPTISSYVVTFFCLHSFPASGSFLMSWLLTSGGQSIGASVSVLPMNIQDWFPLVLTGFDLFAVQGTPKSLLQHHSTKTSILWRSAIFMVQLAHPYMTTGKSVALMRWTFVGKVMSLLFNTLSRFVIAFLPRSKCLLISWLQSLSVVILEPKKSLSLFPLFLHLFAMKWWDQTLLILDFWMLSFKLVFSLSSFTFIKRLFSSSSFSAIRVVSPVYLKLLMFLLAILNLTWGHTKGAKEATLV